MSEVPPKTQWQIQEQKQGQPQGETQGQTHSRMHTQTQQQARRQERIDDLCAATVRALSGERDVRFRGHRLCLDRRALPIHAPHLNLSAEHHDLVSFRGMGDGFALRLANNDAALHARLRPQDGSDHANRANDADGADREDGAASADPVERMVFELLEQFRCEGQVPAGMPGVRHNLRLRFEAWSLAFVNAGGLETATGLLLYTVAQISRSRLTGEPVVEATEDLLEATRAGIGPLIGTALLGLARHRADQAACAVHMLHIARTVAALLRAERERSRGDADESDDEDDDVWTAFALLLDAGDEIDDDIAIAVSGRSRLLDDMDFGYRIFTTAHDRELPAERLVRADLLAEYRARLDQRISGLGINPARLARELQALLSVPESDGWDGGQEAGRIDGRRLAQLVASPTERRLFRTEREAPQADCVVSWLVDCSGSMKEHAESVAVLVDVFVRALEQAGVASEWLGFTTNSWNGGRAQRDWQRAGRPAHPGRLNEICHLIFKDADTPWRRARRAAAALLKADLFREGIDGEAVDWAMRRLAARTEARRILIVISDGSPMDSATALVNDPHYLAHHLRDVVGRHESAGAEIYGLGVGLDLSPFYRHSHVLDLSAGVGAATFREIVAMLRR